MSISNPVDQIEYPESDGRPMGETDVHRKWMIRIFQLLSFRYQGQHTYVGSDLLVYYRAGQPTRFVVPDNFIVFDCDPADRRVFKTWEEKRTPNVIFEVASKSKKREDLITKPRIYEHLAFQNIFCSTQLRSTCARHCKGFVCKAAS